MKILLLAPHPFYQERGTPIAVRLLLEALSRRGVRVDVLTYHEGADIALPGVTLHRLPRLPGIRNIPPGFSLKKLVCDLFLAVRARRLARGGSYRLVHAVEEGALIALWLKRRLGLPYVYDMDSCLSRQLAEKSVLFRPLAPWLQRMETRMIRGALAVVPMCDALAKIARRRGAGQVMVLRDVSLLGDAAGEADDLRLAGTRFMYIGNLEHYQGIDLLLRSFALLHRERQDATLAIVGGRPRDIAYYQARAARLRVDAYVRFTGPRPLAMFAGLCRQADVLVSPRIRGLNTPMKIYSYLQSGRAILATDLPTHTQVLTREVAALAPPQPRRFADAMRYLADHPEERPALARRAAALAAEKYSLPVFERQVGAIYDWLERQA